jgi:hypothetical protein
MPARATAYRLFKLLIIKDFQASKYLVTSKTRLSRIGSSLQVIEKMEREMGFEPTASSLGKLTISQQVGQGSPGVWIALNC